MAYGDTTFGAGHRWSFNNVLTDSIGALTVTNTGGSFVTTPITRDSTHSYQTNGRDDLATVATTADSGSGASTQYAFQGWFRASQIQGPPCLIYGQGGSTAGFALFLWAGNNVMLQCINDAGNQLIQIFSDIALTDNRVYHFFVRFSGNGFNNEVEFYIDAKKQLANKDGVNPNTANLQAHSSPHTWGENGTVGTTIPVGTESVLIKAPVNGFYSEWWTWFGSAADAITQDQLVDTLFASGAIPDLTITSGTEAAMQLQIDAIASSVRPDVPLCITVEEVSGGGDLTLIADNITFDDRAGLHVEYQGTGTLTWINSNGANGSLGTSNVTFVEAVPATITVIDINTSAPIQGARVFLREGSNGTILINDVTDALGQVSINYQYNVDQIVTGRVRKGSTSPLYKTGPIISTITANGLSETVALIPDE